MQMNRQISEGKIYNLLRDCRESLIELVEQLQLIKRPGEDYILDKIQNETKLIWDKNLFTHFLALVLKLVRITHYLELDIPLTITNIPTCVHTRQGIRFWFFFFSKSNWFGIKWISFGWFGKNTSLEEAWFGIERGITKHQNQN